MKFSFFFFFFFFFSLSLSLTTRDLETEIQKTKEQILEVENAHKRNKTSKKEAFFAMLNLVNVLIKWEMNLVGCPVIIFWL
jgi:hypothetical protein